VRTDLIRLMPDTLPRVTRGLVVALLPLAFGACTWFSDFKRQPAIEPWEPMSQNDNDTTHAPRGAPRYSVPISGVEVAGNGVPGYGISYSALPATIDSFSTIANPVAVDARSLENGRKYFQINCAVCHGASGNGIGSKMMKYGFGISLTTGTALTRSDGYLFGMVRNGRGLMPSYNRIEHMDRWDLVNYLRALQGKTALQADTTPEGYAGQNGTTVPGPTLTAPTRPAPFVKPVASPTKGSSGFNSATYPAAATEPRKPGESKEKPE
jgi:mono/diheme cytochrome c family protein